jgi:dihydrofolate synthase/folylpolyglutamate synthase
VVIGELPEEARRVVERACAERSAPLHGVGAESSVSRTRERGLTTVSLQTVRRRYPPIVLALRGDHQVQNATVAVRLLEILDEIGIHVSGEAVATGLATARWPGRLDLVDGGNGREVLLDGAHNPAGAAALASYLRSEWPTGLPLVFGAMRDKDLAGVLRALAPVARPLILTTAPGLRAAEAEDLAAIAYSLGIQDLLVCRDVRGALDAGWNRRPLIAAAGSLYLAGHVLALLGSAPAVSDASREA